ncbi:MAG TPA: alpha/beta hydrolase [Anaerovoracaceae bacterium]|nr:alpha/beta hydrolase [Anaerovoracaceae bacterium]
MKAIQINEGTYPLKGRLYGSIDKSSPRPALIFLSGWNPSRISWTFMDIYAGLCAKKFGIVCVTAALRGMGSEGNIDTLTRSDFLDDVTSIFDYTTHIEGVDKERISFCGESFGAYLACLLSSKRPVKNLILRVPTDFPDAGFFEKPQKDIVGRLSIDWKLQKHLPDESFALHAVQVFKNNIFIIASENDAFVPQQTIENYLEAAVNSRKTEYFLMKNMGHALINPIKQYEFVRILFEIIGSPIFRS